MTAPAPGRVKDGPYLPCREDDGGGGACRPRSGRAGARSLTRPAAGARSAGMILSALFAAFRAIKPTALHSYRKDVATAIKGRTHRIHSLVDLIDE